MWLIPLLALLGLIPGRGDGSLLVSRVTYDEAVVLFADRAMTAPKVEVVLHSGPKRKGKLVQADSAGLTLKGKPPMGWKTVRSIRVLGVNASKSRLAHGAVGGMLSGLTAGVALAVELDGRGGEIWGPAILGAGVGGAYLGTHVASRGQDTLYILRSNPSDLKSDRVGDAGEQEVPRY
jgi:hypothetical protein